MAASVGLCEPCAAGERRAERRDLGLDIAGRTVTVCGVPVEVCPACGEVWLTAEVAGDLDELLGALAALADSGSPVDAVAWDDTLAAGRRGVTEWEAVSGALTPDEVAEGHARARDALGR